MTTVRRIRPEVIARTVCPNGHTDVIEAISPVLEGGELVSAFWSSAFEFCMECDEPITDAKVEVSR